MRAILCGANGAMGKLIDAALGCEVVGRVSIDGENNVPKTFAELGKMEADVLIDFSHHSAIADVLEYAKSIGCAAVIGTTGHTAEEKELIFEAAREIPVFFSGNMSLGIAVLCRLAKQAAAFFPDADIEIVEVPQVVRTFYSLYPLLAYSIPYKNILQATSRSSSRMPFINSSKSASSQSRPNRRQRCSRAVQKSL